MGWGNIIQTVADGVQRRGEAMGQYNQEIHNAAIARQNAGLSREEARRARQEADLAEEAHRRVIREDLGAAFTAIAQSGARGGGGTTADRMLERDATLAELDALNIRYGGDLERGAHLTDAANYDFEAKMAAKRAKTIKQNIPGGTLGRALTAASTYGTSAQNARLRAAERNARNPSYTYGSWAKTHSRSRVARPNPTSKKQSSTNRSVGG